MRKVTLCTLATLALMTVLTGCKAPEYVQQTHTENNSLATPTNLTEAGMRVYWDTQLPMLSNEHVANAWVVQDILYVLTNASNLIAVNTRNSLVLWSVHITDQRERIFPPTHFDGMRLTRKVGDLESILKQQVTEEYDTFNAMLINTPTRLLVVDRSTGKVYRDFKFKGFVAANQGVTDGERFYVASSTRQYQCVGLLEAVNYWNKRIGDGEVIKVPMLYYDGDVFLATLSGTLEWMLASDQGIRKWAVPLPGGISTPFYVNSTGVFAVCDSQFFGLSTQTGRRLWDPVEMPGIPTSGIVAKDGMLYQHLYKRGIHAIDSTNGTIKWTCPKAISILNIEQDTLFAVTKDKELLMIDNATGKVKKTTALKGFSFYPKNVSAAGIFVVNADGRAYCLRPKAAGFITAEMLKNDIEAAAE